MNNTKGKGIRTSTIEKYEKLFHRLYHHKETYASVKKEVAKVHPHLGTVLKDFKLLSYDEKKLQLLPCQNEIIMIIKECNERNYKSIQSRSERLKHIDRTVKPEQMVSKFKYRDSTEEITINENIKPTPLTFIESLDIAKNVYVELSFEDSKQFKEKYQELENWKILGNGNILIPASYLYRKLHNLKAS